MKTFYVFIKTMAMLLLTRGAFAASNADIIWSTNAHYALQGVSLSGDSKLVASCGFDGVKVWQATNVSLIQSFLVASTEPTCVSLSSNGQHVFAGMGNGQVRMWRVSDGVLLWFNQPGGQFIFDVDVASSGFFCANSTGDYINRRNPATGSGYIFSGHEGSVTSVAFSPDSTLLASGGSDATARIWRVSDGTTLQTLTGHGGGLYSVDFSPDGRLLATTSGDGTARLWNVTNGICERIIESGGDSAQFSANGRLLLTLTDGLFQIWRVSDGQRVGTIINTGAVKFDIAKNGQYFAYGTGVAVVLARLPITLDSIIRTGNETVLNWQGGSGLYQLQSNPNVTTTGWQNLGPATTNTIATNVSTATLFFRVQSLPNP